MTNDEFMEFIKNIQSSKTGEEKETYKFKSSIILMKMQLISHTFNEKYDFIFVNSDYNDLVYNINVLWEEELQSKIHTVRKPLKNPFKTG
ncbi:hypothetical protein Ecwhy1_542 [Escherichia phage Ecwhy_1]|nr:hypothetical protein Ecwhy1_542 [Escherichia phage Ecwhy_1]